MERQERESEREREREREGETERERERDRERETHRRKRERERERQTVSFEDHTNARCAGFTAQFLRWQRRYWGFLESKLCWRGQR